MDRRHSLNWYNNMKKYLVNVYIPATGKHLDVYLPTGKQIGEATRLIANMAESLSNGSYKSTINTMLLNANNGEPLDNNKTVYDVGIRNSYKLILI